MANTKVTQHVIANNAITADQLASAAVTDAKLHSTLDLSGKTLTLPATAIPSASTATTQSASDNSTKIATTAYVTTALANLVDSSPSSLNTLNELAAALNDDASFSTTVTNSIATKLPLAGGTLTGALTLSGAPTSGLHPATKTYTDTADALKLNLSGGTLTGDLVLNTTGALKVPVGTTGQRPTAATGQIRWNSTDGALEVYNGTAWTAVGTGSSNKVLDTFTGDDSTTDFTLSVTPANEDAIMVFIDGAYQEKGDYVLTNAVLALDTAPLSGEKIAVHITTAAVHDGTSAVNQQFTATAGQTAFTLSQDPSSENNTQVYINGVYQQKTDYTVSGTTLTFDTGLTVGDVVEVNMFTVATLGNTDTVTEGVGNLYHTTARARSAISVSGNALSYNSSTGVITSAYEESPAFTGSVDVAGNITVGNNDSILAENNLRFKSSGAAYIDHNTTGQSIVFRTSNSSALDTTPLIIDHLGNSTIRSGGKLIINRTDNATGGEITYGPSSGTGFIFNDANSDGIDFKTGSTMIMSIDSTNQKVGIGTSSPLGKLSVGAGSINDAGLPVQISTGADGTQAWYAVNRNGGYGALFGYSASSTYKGLVLRNVVASGTSNADGISFMTNNTSMRMHITGDGNVGINTAAPEHDLHVYTAGQNQDGILKIGGSSSGLGIELRYDQSGVTTSHLVVNPTYTNANSIFHICVDGDANPNQFVLKGDGKIGINNNGAAWVDANDRLITNGRGVFRGYGHSPLALGRYNSAASAGETGSMIAFLYGGGGVGTISITTNSTQYNTTSDVRLKDNIKTIVDGSSKIMAMNPVSHTWKANPTEDAVHGFIAQEMKDIVPESVTGEPESEEMMQMDYGRITPIIVAGLQDALKEIEKLKERINELENK